MKSKILALLSVPFCITMLILEEEWLVFIFYILFCLVLLAANTIKIKTQDLPDSLTKILKQQNRYRE